MRAYISHPSHVSNCLQSVPIILQEQRHKKQVLTVPRLHDVNANVMQTDLYAQN